MSGSWKGARRVLGGPVTDCVDALLKADVAVLMFGAGPEEALANDTAENSLLALTARRRMHGRR